MATTGRLSDTLDSPARTSRRLLGSMLLAWITTLGTTARLDPEHIRSE